MITNNKKNWSIVILGKWNVNIFSPQWLIQNVLTSDTIDMEFSAEPGVPHKIIDTAGDIMIIPNYSKLIIAPINIIESSLLNVERTACNILDKLPHTPIAQLGLNFGYSCDDLGVENREKLENVFSDQFADFNL